MKICIQITNYDAYIYINANIYSHIHIYEQHLQRGNERTREAYLKVKNLTINWNCKHWQLVHDIELVMI